MKTVCVYHSRDLDGWMSAAIVKRWFIISNKNISCEYSNNTYTTMNNGDSVTFIGYDYGQPIPNLDNCDEVVMVDVSFPKDAMRTLFETKSKFVWLDHHSSAIKDMGSNIPMEFTEDYSIKHAACELTWQYFFPNDAMPEIVRLLGRYDCFGHKGTNEELKVLEFQYGARQCISNYEKAYEELRTSISTADYSTEIIHEKGKTIYEYVCTEAKQIYKRAFPINFALSEEGVGGGGGAILYRFLCVNQDRFNPINFGIDYHRDNYDGFACFWFANGKWNFSLYNDNGEVDCSVIAKQFGGGGHKGAAGFVTTDFKSILGI